MARDKTSKEICFKKPYKVRVADELMRSIGSQYVDWQWNLDPAKIPYIKEVNYGEIHLPLL